MDLDKLREKVSFYRNTAGYSQKALALAIGLNPSVLSSKLNGSVQAKLTHQEVKQIIKTLAGWQAITEQSQAIELLKLAGLKPNVFSEEEWKTAPLVSLERSYDPTSVSEDKARDQKNKSKKPVHNLPASILPFIGREKEAKHARELILTGEARLLTITGPGGIGKTRLALQVAAELVEEFEDGVFFVSLDSLLDPALLENTIARTLKLDEIPLKSIGEILQNYFRDKQMLLVLDNFEQLLPGVPVLENILAASFGLKIMVTSRAVLHLYGEHELPIRSMEWPGPDVLRLNPAPEVLAEYEAVKIFLKRSQRSLPSFAPTRENIGAIVEICAHLDGIPLSIELAAARVKILSPQQLLELLVKGGSLVSPMRRLDLLTNGPVNFSPRHQTLRNTLDWSYNLLEPDEKIFFYRLSVFLGGFTVEAVHYLAIGEGTVDENNSSKGNFAALAGLILLLEKSMIEQESRCKDNEHFDSRFRMLETIREYAFERLRKSGEEAEMRWRHAKYFLDVAEKAERQLTGPEQTQWLDKLEEDLDNFRAVLFWATETTEDLVNPFPIQNSELALRLCAALWRYWLARTHLSEGLRWIQAALKMTSGSPYPDHLLEVRARSLNGGGILSRNLGNYPLAIKLLEESLALQQQLHNLPGQAQTLNSLGTVAYYQTNYRQALRYYEESLTLQRLTGNTRGIMVVLVNIANILQDHEGRYAEAQTYLEESKFRFQELGEKRGLAYVLLGLGTVQGYQGFFVQAYEHIGQSIALFEEINDKYGLAFCLEKFAHIKSRNGDYEAAQDLFWKSIEQALQLEEKRVIISCLEGFAIIRSKTGGFLASAVLRGGIETLLNTSKFIFPYPEKVADEQLHTQLLSELGDSTLKEKLAEGIALSLEEVLAFTSLQFPPLPSVPRLKSYLTTLRYPTKKEEGL
ncbi:MAG: tetratricopeptide repeat protein [Chloroflexota bacterium]